jgi:acyl-CoA thioester hydrolase
MGVAHHSVYPIWFEAGRTAFIRGQGMPYGKLESDGLYLPLIGLACDYKSFSRYEDELVINTRVSDVTMTRIKFIYDVIKEQLTIASGSTTHIFANRLLKPVNLQKYMPGAYRLFRSFAGFDD